MPIAYHFGVSQRLLVACSTYVLLYLRSLKPTTETLLEYWKYLTENYLFRQSK
jgi:hypothetical protein